MTRSFCRSLRNSSNLLIVNDRKIPDFTHVIQRCRFHQRVIMIQLGDMLLVPAQDLDVSADTQRLLCVDSKKIIVLFLTDNLF